MRRRSSSAWLVALLSACSSRPVAVEDAGGSTSDGSEGTGRDEVSDTTAGGVGSTAASGEVETADTTASGSTGSEESTGDPAEVHHLRFIVQRRVSQGDDYEVVLREVTEGVLSEPMLLDPGSATTDMGLQLFAFDEGQSVGRCLSYTECVVYDLSDELVGAPQAVALPRGASGFAYLLWSGPSRNFVFPVLDDVDPFAASLHAAAYVDGTLEPTRMLAPGPVDPYSYDVDPGRDGAWVAYMMEVDGVRNVHVSALTAAGPPDPVRVGAAVDPALATREPSLVPGADAVAFTTGPNESTFDDALLYARFPGGVAEPPVVVDGPLAAGSRVFPPIRVAPDGHALAWLTRGPQERISFSDLSTGLPGAPVVLTDPGFLGQGPLSWSPDSRWIAFIGRDATEPDWQLFLAEASGPSPGPPHRVSSNPIWVLSRLEFDDAGAWLYVLDGVRLYRVDVSGAEPGPAQPVAGGGSSPVDRFVLADDGSAVVLTQWTGAHRELLSIDVAGPEVGPAVQLNAPLGLDVDVGRYFHLSPDASAVLYRECGPDTDDCSPSSLAPEPGYLVDRTSGEVVQVSEDASFLRFVADRIE